MVANGVVERMSVMRALAISLGLVALPLSLANAAEPGPLTPVASVTVTIDPAFAKVGGKDYGLRDLQGLADSLKKSVEGQLSAKGRLTPGAADAATVNLVLIDAKPNRPTFKQMADRPGLSMESFGIGGAEVKGEQVMPGGGKIMLGYSWYENDIRWSQAQATWSDAERAIDGFARRLAEGDAEAPPKK
jgi:hypothetical protein